MAQSARVQVCRSRTVLVMSPNGPGENCPRLILSGNRSAKLRDDYHGTTTASRKLLRKLCSL